MADLRIKTTLDGFTLVVPGAPARSYTLWVLGSCLLLSPCAVGASYVSAQRDLLFGQASEVDLWPNLLAMLLVTAALVATTEIIARMARAKVEVQVQGPRLFVRRGAHTHGAVLTGASVSVGPVSVDIDPLQGRPVRIPCGHLQPDKRERIASLLRRAAGNNNDGQPNEVPQALRQLTEDR